MSMRALMLATAATVVIAARAGAVPTATTTHGPQSTSLNGSIAAGDLISGLIPTVLAGDQGWHPANTDPLDQLAAFTDDAGIRGTGLTGLLNDFPPSGAPAKRVEYALGGPKDIGKIQILTGNNGKDGRVFSTTVVSTSTDGTTFAPLGYFQSDLSGTTNAGTWGSTLVAITNLGGGALATGATHVRFELYGVDNTGGQMRDPFDGVNPFTGVDDLLNAPNSSPLVFELDVIAIPEPGSLAICGTALAALATARRRMT